jgi:hypothetical protein
MSADGDEPALRFVETTVGLPVAEHGSGVTEAGRRRPGRTLDRRWLMAGALVATLLVGIVIGFVSGRHSVTGAPATSVPPASRLRVSAHAPSLGERCSTQSGEQLRLGVEIVNDSAVPLTIDQVRVVLPLRGLRTRLISLGGCGTLDHSPSDQVDGHSVGPYGSAWITMAMDVLVPCPAPLPVQLRVRTTQSGAVNSTELSPFPALGGVRYSGCR